MLPGFCCSEFYEANALMMEEEGAIIAGLLVGLNVIDANFCMKGEDLDSQVWGILLKPMVSLCVLSSHTNQVRRHCEHQKQDFLSFCCSCRVNI